MKMKRHYKMELDEEEALALISAIKFALEEEDNAEKGTMMGLITTLKDCVYRE